MSRTGFFIFNTRVNFNLTHNRPSDHFLLVFFFLLNSHLSAGPEPSWFTYALSLHYSTLPCSVRPRWDSSLEEDSFVRLPLTDVFAFVPLNVPLGRKTGLTSPRQRAEMARGPWEGVIVLSCRGDRGLPWDGLSDLKINQSVTGPSEFNSRLNQWGGSGWGNAQQSKIVALDN